MLFEFATVVANKIYVNVKDTYTKDVHGKISDSASEGQIISAFLNNDIDI